MANEFLISLLPYIKEGSLSGMVVHHVITAIVYMYLYPSMVGNQYAGYRDSFDELKIGVLLSIFVGYIHNPVLSLFGMKYY